MVPAPSGASFANASSERSMIHPLTKGPRSSIITVTVSPLARLVTRTRVPFGRVLWAATIPVLWYQEAVPTEVFGSRVPTRMIWLKGSRTRRSKSNSRPVSVPFSMRRRYMNSCTPGAPKRWTSLTPLMRSSVDLVSVLNGISLRVISDWN